MILFFSHHRARMSRRIAAFQAGDLSPAEHAAVSRHLTACPHCSEELRALEETDRLLRAAAPPVAGLPRETSRAMFERALDESGVLRRRAGVRWQIYAWATPAVLLVLGSSLAVRETRKPAANSTERPGTALQSARIEPPAPSVVISPRSSTAPMGPPAPKPEVRPLVAPAPRRLVRTSIPKTAKTPLEVVKLEPSEPLTWIPEPVLAAGVEQVELVADGEPAAPPASGAEEPTTRLAAESLTAPVVDVQISMAESKPTGTARVAAWWREPSGEWFWKQARVPKDEELVELVLVSLSQDRIWGYWKEKTE